MRFSTFCATEMTGYCFVRSLSAKLLHSSDETFVVLCIGSAEVDRKNGLQAYHGLSGTSMSLGSR